MAIRICMAHDDESEDIEDLGTAGDLIDGIEKMLAGLRHLLGDVEDHETEEMGDQEADAEGGPQVILPLSGPPAMEAVFRVCEVSDLTSKYPEAFGPDLASHYVDDKVDPKDFEERGGRLVWKNGPAGSKEDPTWDPQKKLWTVKSDDGKTMTLSAYGADGHDEYGTTPKGFNSEALVKEETSDEWARENPTCTPQVAKKILKQHGLEWLDFVDENPDQKMTQRVDSQKLLAWMGY